jgi:hypothetical protein
VKKCFLMILNYLMVYLLVLNIEALRELRCKNIS